MRLETTVSGPEDGPRLAIVHGLFGQARNWGTIQSRLSDIYRVTAVDLRNHGASPWDASHTYPDLAADLAETLDGTTHVLGHSMGGKAAMMLALTEPDLVDRLVVADMAPRAYGHSMMPYVEAMQALDLDAIETRRDADRALADHIPEKAVRMFLLQNLDTASKSWGLNLDVLGREMDTIGGWPEVEGQFERPAMFLHGETSDYMDDAGKEAARAHFPRARFVEVANAGHWLHAEQPDAVVESLRVFLAG